MRVICSNIVVYLYLVRVKPMRTLKKHELMSKHTSYLYETTQQSGVSYRMWQVDISHTQFGYIVQEIKSQKVWQPLDFSICN